MGWVLMGTGLLWIGSTMLAPRWQFRARSVFCFSCVASLLSGQLGFGSAFWLIVFGWWGIQSWKQGVPPNWAFDELARENMEPFDGERHEPQPITPTALTPAPFSESVAEFASESLVARADESGAAREALAAKVAGQS